MRRGEGQSNCSCCLASNLTYYKRIVVGRGNKFAADTYSKPAGIRNLTNCSKHTSVVAKLTGGN